MRKDWRPCVLCRCACACTNMSSAHSRPESYTDDLELAEGLTAGNGLLVFISLVAEWIPFYEHEEYYPAMLILVHERKMGWKKIMLWGLFSPGMNALVFYNCSSAEKWNIFPSHIQEWSVYSFALKMPQYNVLMFFNARNIHFFTIIYHLWTHWPHFHETVFERNSIFFSTIKTCFLFWCKVFKKMSRSFSQVKNVTQWLCILLLSLYFFFLLTNS